MAIYADRGVPVTMVCATRGEVGEISPGTDATPETLGAFREQELRDAMALLGVHDVRFLDFRDSGMYGTPENDDPRSFINARPEDVIGSLVRIIRERRPDVVVTWDASGGYGHPDHIAVHEHATAATRAAAAADQFPDFGAPWRTPRLFYTAIPMEEFETLMNEIRATGEDTPPVAEDPRMASLPRVRPNCVIDVSSAFERKEQALVAHRTQLADLESIMRLPVEVRRRFFGREFFYLADPPLADGRTLQDFLQPLD